MIARWIFLGICVAAALPAQAQTADDPPAIDVAYLVQVQPGPKRYFWGDGSEVPARAERPGKAYVVPGDKLLAFSERDGFVFAEYISEAGRAHVGWIESAGLRRVTLPGPSAADWIGTWMGWDGSIDIARAKKPGVLHFEGQATWGSHDPARVASGGINLGEFEADVMPKGNRIAIADGEPEPWPATYDDDKRYDDNGVSCRVKMRVLGPYLLARDNLGCGGVNVTFTGEYRR
jgi:hypothetical protein